MKKIYSLSALAFIATQLLNAQCGPSISCPSNISVNNTSGSCGAIVNYPPATASTTCGGTTTVYSENFQAGVGGWTLNVATGTNAATPNSWEVNATEGGVAPPGCGVANNGDLTLHITCTSAFCGSLITGAVYNAAKTSNKRAESPVINTTSYSNLTLNFNFISNGDALLDNASVVYNDGSGWQVLSASIKSPVCGGGQGQWTAYTATLPASCNNNPNVKIGFNWTNNADNIGTDPSVAINDITITAPGASTPTISYSIASGSFFPVGTSTVTATATDALLNTASCNFLVTVNDVQAPVISNCPGNITVNANNANCTAVVNWTSASATDNCSGSTLGVSQASGTVFPVGTTTVTYTATDASNNTSTCSFNVTVVNNLNASASATNAACFGQANGSANVNVLSGNSPYTYAWSPAGGSAASASSLAAGNYTCLITDAAGCTLSSSVTVNAPAQITASQNQTICQGQAYTIGSSSYTSAGTYMDTLQSVAGCDSIVTTMLAVNTSPVVAISSSLPVVACEGSIDTLIATGATNYVWSTSATTDTIIVTHAPGTNQWIVTGTNANGCSDADTVNTTVSALVPINLDMNSIDTQCVSNGIINLNGVAAPGGGMWSGPGVSGFTFNPAAAGPGTHTLTYTFTNGQGCVSTATGNIFVDACLGLLSANNENNFASLFPNPNNGNFILDAKKDAKMEVYNALGELVLTQKVVAGKNAVLVERAAGLYLVKIYADNKVQQIRVVKN